MSTYSSIARYTENRSTAILRAPSRSRRCNAESASISRRRPRASSDERTTLEREGRNADRLLQVRLVRLLSEARPQDDELPPCKAEARPCGGSLVVGWRREPGYVDPPADAADASRWKAELEEAPTVRFRKRYDHGEARKACQQHGVIQGAIAMIRGRGKGQWDLPADGPEDHGRGTEVVREVNHIRAKRTLTPSDLSEDDRHVRRLAHIIVHAPELRMLGIEPGVGSKVDRDLGNMADREAVPRRRFDVHGQGLDLVTGLEESPNHVEPEVLVPGVAERQDPFAHDHDSQR